MNIAKITPNMYQAKAQNVSKNASKVAFGHGLNRIVTKPIEPRKDDEMDIPLEVWRSLVGGNPSNSCTDYGRLIDGHAITTEVKPETEMPNIRNYIYVGNNANLNTKKMYEDYYQALHDACFEENGKLKDSVVGYFKGKVFAMTDTDGKKGLQTVPQFLKGNIRKNPPNPWYNPTGKGMMYYHATDTRETAQKIKEEGFDPNKLSRSQYGPGVYLALSEGAARSYGSCVMLCRLNSDRSGHVGDKFYDRLRYSNVTKQIADDFGFKRTEDAMADVIQMKFANDLLDTFARDYIRDAMQIDYLTCPVGLVVLSPAKISVEDVW